MAKSLPSDYVEIGGWRLDQTPSWLLIVLSGFSFIAFFAALFAALVLVSLATGVDTISLDLQGILLGLVLGVALHEVTHVVVFRVFGARPRFGFKLWTRLGPLFYVSAPGSYLRRAEYLAVGLAPVSLLTVLLLVAAVLLPAGSSVSSVVVFAVGVNVGGSVGDMLIARKVLSYPGTAYFEDTADGFIAYGRAET